MDGGPVTAAFPRIAIAGFQHETNTLTPPFTSYSDFQDGGGWPGLTRGKALPEVFKGLNIPISGFISAAEEKAELFPILWASAEPANRVSVDAFDRISSEIIEKIAKGADAVYLDLHGAMVTDEVEDGEAELLRRIRARFGDELPIAISLDLHANISADLIKLSDIVTIYRTYPHLDMDRTGARAFEHLMRMIDTGQRPAKAFRQIPFLIPLSAQCTDYGPLKTLYQNLAQTGLGVWSADIALGFPLAEISDVGPSIVTYTDTQHQADQSVDELARRFQAEAYDLPNDLLTPAEAIQRAMDTTGRKPVILADVQDNSGAGAMSDSTGLLAAMVRLAKGANLIGAIWDPAVAEQAHKAGVGAKIDAKIGGASGPEGVMPFACAARVIAVSDGKFVCKGAMQRDVATDVGLTALLRIGAAEGYVDALITTHRHQAIDREVFHHVGVDLTNYRIVGVKSTVHFRADFTPVAENILMVDAPGYSPCRIKAL